MAIKIIALWSRSGKATHHEEVSELKKEPLFYLFIPFYLFSNASLDTNSHIFVTVQANTKRHFIPHEIPVLYVLKRTCGC